jgi:long-chain acyl-CoA synthetase
MNIAKNLENAAYYFPQQTAVIDDSGQYSYGQFNRMAAQAASSLNKRGVGPGDHVALCAPNSFDWLAFYFGAIKIGAVAVTFSYLIKKKEIKHILEDCQPKALFTIDEKLMDIGDRKDYPFLETLVCDTGDVTFNGLMNEGTEHFMAVDVNRDDTAAILYTGGTTGTPKGARLSHANLQAAVHNVSFYERSNPKDCVLCFLPLNHVFAQIHIMHATIYSAGTTVLHAAFDLEKALYAMKNLRITKFYAVPTIYIRLLALNNLNDVISTIRYCFSAAASMAAETVREWKERTRLNIHEAYGMTESASMVTYNHYYRHVIGSVGTPASLVEVQIRDQNGNILPHGQKGEICICGPNIMKGYLNSPEETASAFWGHWFRSGDIGQIDAGGYLFIVDRLKDMVITGGENVYPREIEEVLYTLPEIQECAVVGLPDREYGERLTAFVIPNPGHELDPLALKRVLKAQLAPFKIPKAFISLEELPKNNAGKILKRHLKKEYTGE